MRDRQILKGTFTKEEVSSRVLFRALLRRILSISNRRWRQRREGAESLGDKEQELDDKEKRKLKNREWRQKRESPGGSLQEKEEPRLCSMLPCG